MTLNEGLCREVARVAACKSHAQELPANSGAFYIAVCDAALEKAYEAMGNGDIIDMATALQELRGIEE